MGTTLQACSCDDTSSKLRYDYDAHLATRVVSKALLSKQKGTRGSSQSLNELTLADQPAGRREQLNVAKMKEIKSSFKYLTNRIRQKVELI